jgi:hypothetical protein
MLLDAFVDQLSSFSPFYFVISACYDLGIDSRRVWLITDVSVSSSNSFNQNLSNSSLKNSEKNIAN